MLLGPHIRHYMGDSKILAIIIKVFLFRDLKLSGALKPVYSGGYISFTANGV